MNLYHCIIVAIITSVRLRLQILTSRYHFIIWSLFKNIMYVFIFQMYLWKICVFLKRSFFFVLLFLFILLFYLMLLHSNCLVLSLLKPCCQPWLYSIINFSLEQLDCCSKQSFSNIFETQSLKNSCFNEIEISEQVNIFFILTRNV